MNVTMTRVNGVYERDMSLTMVIVPNNTNVIFFLPEKPDALTNSSGYKNKVTIKITTSKGVKNISGTVFGEDVQRVLEPLLCFLPR